MTSGSELDAVVRAIVDANQYMTLATADPAGVPWASPVWYAVADYREFFWVSDRRRGIRATSRRGATSAS